MKIPNDDTLTGMMIFFFSSTTGIGVALCFKDFGIGLAVFSLLCLFHVRGK